jgi:hypothetical protein
MDIERIKQVGIAAACNGGKVLQEHFGNFDRFAKKALSIWSPKLTSNRRRPSLIPSPRPFPITPSWRKRAGHMRAAVAAGSSIRWTAPPTLPTTCRYFVSPSPLRSMMTFWPDSSWRPFWANCSWESRTRGPNSTECPFSYPTYPYACRQPAGHRFSLRSPDH